MNNEQSTKQPFAIEEHPFKGILLYTIIAFALQFFISDSFVAMCIVDFFFFIYVLIRKVKYPIKQPIYTVNTWVLCAISTVLLIFTTYCWSRWYMTTIADSLSVDYATSMSNADIYVYLFMIAIAAPMGEESLYRYIVLNGFFKMFEKTPKIAQYALSVTLSSLLFGVMHGTGVHLLIGFFCGMALSLIYLTTNKLWLAMLVHSLYNIGTLFVYVPVSLILCVVLTIFCFTFVGIMVYNLCYKQITLSSV